MAGALVLDPDGKERAAKGGLNNLSAFDKEQSNKQQQRQPVQQRQRQVPNLKQLQQSGGAQQQPGLDVLEKTPSKTPVHAPPLMRTVTPVKFARQLL